MTPDLKVYNSDIYLEGEYPGLRTGMSCKVEIIVAQFEEAVYIPVQAVIRVAGQPTVYVVKEDRSIEERVVEIGLDNNRMVRIISGLSEGEVVWLTPPLKSASVESGSEAGGSGSDPSGGPDTTMQQINQKLEEANRTPPRVDGPDGFSQRGQEGQERRPRPQDAEGQGGGPRPQRSSGGGQ